MLLLLILWALFSCSLLAQSSPPTGSQRAGSDTYEDDEVKVAIPVGWARVVQKYPERAPVVQLVVQKDGYTLALVFRAGHASPVPGGRFIEAFRMPWLSIDDAWDCSTVLTIQVPQPVSRILMFENFVLDTADSHVRERCGIAKNLSEWVGQDSAKQLVGARRWFAGYFTSRAGSYFFDESDDRSCFSKLYTLTSSAQKPEQLPVVGEPHLQRLIQESIDIVNSIYYKRCAPKLSQPFH